MLQSNDSSGVSDGDETGATSLQPMGFTDILDSMFSLYRNHFRQFVSICSVYFICGLVINLLYGISTVSAASSGQFSTLILMTIVLFLIGTVVTLFVIGGLVFASAQAFLDKQITASTAFRQIRRRFLPYLGSNLLYALVVGLLMITCLGIPLAVFFAFRWIFCSLAAVFEEKSAVSALKRSSELVKGGWWRVFGMMIAIFLLLFFVQFILQFSLLFVLGLSQAIGGDGDLAEILRQMFMPQLTTWEELIAYSIRNFVILAITSLMLPVGIIGATLVYFDQRIRKEGFDIEIRMTGEEA